MSWLALELEVEGAAAEPLSEALLELGADSVSIEEARGPFELEVLQPEDGGPRWERHRLRAIIAPATDPVCLLRHAAEAAGLPAAPAFVIQKVEPEDWVRRTQSQFGPLHIGERLWIVPSWAERPAVGDAVVLRIDPGLAFGTGSHATTRLVLGWLERQSGGRTAASVLDYGCGSGILALAAGKLGAAEIVATDNDPQALRTCTDNAAINGVSIAILPPEEIGARRFDVIVANILARPLIELAPRLAGFARQGTALALSGILQEQADEVIRGYQAWFDVAVEGTDEGWALLTGVRR